MRNKKAILDTNLWISFLISKNLESLDEFLIKGRLTLVFSNELIDEFLNALRKLRFFHGLISCKK